MVDTNTLSIDGTEYVAGLEWLVANESRLQKDIAAATSSVGSTTGLVMRVGGDARVGIGNARDKGKPSAAAVLAQCHENVMLVQPLTDTLYWFVYVVRGLVFPRSDYIGTLSEVKERLKLVASKVSTIEEGMRTCAPGLNNHSEFEKFEQTDFARLISKADPSKSLKLKSLKPMVTRERALVLVAVLVVAFIFWPSKKHDVQNAVSRVVQVSTAPKPAVMSDAQRLVKLDAIISSALAGKDPHDAFASLSGQINYFWPSKAGWNLQNIILTPGSNAVVTLKRGVSATIDDLQAALSANSTVSFSGDGSNATVNVPLNASQAGSSDDGSVDLSGYHKVENSLVSDFQRLGLRIEIQVGTIPDTAFGPNFRQTLQLSPQDPIPAKEVKWRVTTNYSSLAVVEQVLSKYPSLGVDQMSYQSNSSEKVEVAGVLYESN